MSAEENKALFRRYVEEGWAVQETSYGEACVWCPECVIR
jgi:hypothetical protein